MSYNDGGKIVSGGMTPGDGETTLVQLDNDLSAKDKAILCATICQCRNEPDIGAKGQSLKQQCVSAKLKERDKNSNFQSVYKPEVNYDMSKSPPTPIMRSANELEPHAYLPGWIEKYWPGGLKSYEPGIGNVRRPDVVVVKDPTRPPTQDNLKSVVEIKFPPQQRDPVQAKQDERIAGPYASTTTLTPKNCGCDDKEQPQEEPATSSVSEELDSIGRQLKGLLNKRPALGAPGGSMPPPFNPGILF